VQTRLWCENLSSAFHRSDPSLLCKIQNRFICIEVRVTIPRFYTSRSSLTGYIIPLAIAILILRSMRISGGGAARGGGASRGMGRKRIVFLTVDVYVVERGPSFALSSSEFATPRLMFFFICPHFSFLNAPLLDYKRSCCGFRYDSIWSLSKPFEFCGKLSFSFLSILPTHSALMKLKIHGSSHCKNKNKNVSEPLLFQAPSECSVTNVMRLKNRGACLRCRRLREVLTHLCFVGIISILEAHQKWIWELGILHINFCPSTG